MSFGTSSSAVSSSVYTIEVTHTNSVTLVLQGSNSEASVSNMEELVQDLIDLIDGSSDFTVASSRVYPTNQEITPT